MGRKAKAIILTPEIKAKLEETVRARTTQAQIVNRARILLLKADGATIYCTDA